MKTLKQMLLILIAIASFSSAKAQCDAHFYASQVGIATWYFQCTDSFGTFNWDLGDGSTDSHGYLWHNYAASGTYIVCLTRDNGGCTDTKCDTVIVDVCGFTPTHSSTNIDDTTVQFYSNAGSGQSATYSWSIPGVTPGTYTSQNPLVVFPHSGMFYYTLTVVSSGCTKNIYDSVNVVVPPPIPCSALFALTTHSSTADFYASDHTPGRTYTWDFGDGTSTSGDSITEHIYSASGTYIVCLTVAAGNGSCSDTHCDTISVSGPPCMNFISHQDLGFGLVNFTAALDSFSNSGGTYTWDFGDGTSGTGQYATHTYATSDTFNACVTYSGAVCSGTLCESVPIDTCQIMSSIYYSVAPNTYDVSFNYQNYSGATYQWTFNGASPSSSSIVNPTVTYPTYGNYSACLTVTSQSGCVATPCVNFDVPNPCHAQIWPYQTGETVMQFNSAPIDTVNPGSYNYAWTFGDGASSSLSNPIHDYGSYGQWNVCLTVTGANCTDTVCQNVTVAPLPPPTYNLSGFISRNGASACSGTVYLIKDSIGFLSLVYTTILIDSGLGNCSGSYGFCCVPQGTYYVKAALDANDADYASYMPTYYGQVLNWSSATAINLNTNLYSENINLIAGVNPGGPGFVGGWVSQGAGLALGGSNIGRSTGDPLPNIQVNLLTINDVPVASARTDANGRYAFSNLALGTYKVYAEEINKVPYALDVTLTANNPSQDNVDVSVNSTSAVTGLDDLSDIHLEGVFPNPVSDKTVIGISLKQNSKVWMSLTDVDGRQIQNKNLDLISGNNEIKLDLSNEMAGVYNLSLTNDVSKKIIRIVKIK